MFFPATPDASSSWSGIFVNLAVTIPATIVVAHYLMRVGLPTSIVVEPADEQIAEERGAAAAESQRQLGRGDEAQLESRRAAINAYLARLPKTKRYQRCLFFALLCFLCAYLSWVSYYVARLAWQDPSHGWRFVLTTSLSDLNSVFLIFFGYTLIRGIALDIWTALRWGSFAIPIIPTCNSLLYYLARLLFGADEDAAAVLRICSVSVAFAAPIVMGLGVLVRFGMARVVGLSVIYAVSQPIAYILIAKSKPPCSDTISGACVVVLYSLAAMKLLLLTTTLNVLRYMPRSLGSVFRALDRSTTTTFVAPTRLRMRPLIDVAITLMIAIPLLGQVLHPSMWRGTVLILSILGPVVTLLFLTDPAVRILKSWPKLLRKKALWWSVGVSLFANFLSSDLVLGTLKEVWNWVRSFLFG